MRNIIGLAFGVGVALTGCSTTQREEVHRDQRDLHEQRRDVEAAMRDGTKNEVREEQADVRKAEKELRKDRKALYTAGAGNGGGALQVGQRASDGLDPVPERYRAQYVDGQGSYYRSDGTMIYKIASADQIVTEVYRMTP